jgi:hypothetical protein
MTLTATKIDSSHESGKNFIRWAWPASTTIIYNNPVLVACDIFILNYIMNNLVNIDNDNLHFEILIAVFTVVV